MIVIDKTIVSDHLIEKKFVCNLEKCKGACCVEGESGAPLEENEPEILESIYDKVKPFMEQTGVDTIEELGKYMIDSDGDFVTPLVAANKQCAYVFFENKIAKCAIEKAFYEGKIDFKKPVSCHLYPVRIKKYPEYDAVNYSHWDVCSPACLNGKKLDVPVYEFVKEALIRKYGDDWYAQLEGAAAYKSDNS